jgi:hypothetical protein
MIQPPDESLKALWKSQETETGRMSLDTIRALVRKERARRRLSIIALGSIAVWTIPMFAWMACTSANELSLAGYLIILAGFVWLFWRGIRIWLKPPREDSSATVLIDFHRTQLVRQRQAGGFRGTTVTSAPILLGLLVAVAGLAERLPEGRRRDVFVLLGLIGLWMVMMAVITWRNRRTLQARVDELDALRG